MWAFLITLWNAIKCKVPITKAILRKFLTVYCFKQHMNNTVCKQTREWNGLWYKPDQHQGQLPMNTARLQCRGFGCIQEFRSHPLKRYYTKWIQGQHSVQQSTFTNKTKWTFTNQLNLTDMNFLSYILYMLSFCSHRVVTLTLPLLYSTTGNASDMHYTFRTLNLRDLCY